MLPESFRSREDGGGWIQGRDCDESDRDAT